SLVVSGPRAVEPFGVRPERVLHNAEGAGHLSVDAREGARQVEAVGFEFLKVRTVVEVGVENSAVMFPGCDENRRFAAEEQVVGIIGVQGDRLAGSRKRNFNGQQKNDRGKSLSL